MENSSEKRNMERKRRIYNEMQMLLDDLSVKAAFGYPTAFRAKVASLEIMHRETMKKVKSLETAAKEEDAEGKVAFPRITTAWHEAIAFFEAYLNAFYSLLQIIAKFTPHFYEKDNKNRIPDDHFGGQVNFFVKNPESDPVLSSYLTDKMGWYATLRNNRHAVTHRLSAFLGFNRNGSILFFDYPKNRFDMIDEKSHRGIEAYMIQSFNELFDFMEFYAQHFRKMVPESQKTKLLRRCLA